MNYRHAYHAGNHTEVFKHSVLCLLLAELRRKPAPFTVIDSHAGVGTYDLMAPQARRTAEADQGIGRVFDKEISAAPDYLNIVRKLNPDALRYYPGSPVIIQSLLRSDDRLIACELHEEDAASLRACLQADKRVAVHHRDGHEAISAFIPPRSNRGLVFIDPPFEERDEFTRIADSLNRGLRKWPSGMFTAWYPLKERAGVDQLRARYKRNATPTLCCELLLKPINGTELAGSGIVICNPPWKFEERLQDLCRELLNALGTTTGKFSLAWWIKEARS